MKRRNPSRLRNLSIAGIAALTGCISLIVIAAALFIGLWLDSMMGRRGPATICLLILSVPISLFLMIRTALGLVRRIPAPVPGEKRRVLPDEKEE